MNQQSAWQDVKRKGSRRYEENVRRRQAWIDRVKEGTIVAYHEELEKLKEMKEWDTETCDQLVYMLEQAYKCINNLSKLNAQLTDELSTVKRQVREITTAAKPATVVEKTALSFAALTTEDGDEE